MLFFSAVSQNSSSYGFLFQRFEPISLTISVLSRGVVRCKYPVNSLGGSQSPGSHRLCIYVLPLFAHHLSRSSVFTVGLGLDNTSLLSLPITIIALPCLLDP